MASVLSPPASAASPSHSPAADSSSDSLPLLPQARPRPREDRERERERVPSYAANRMSQYSRSSQRSRPQSPAAAEFPAFASSLPYALVRDFAYPSFHPLHYGAEPEGSGASTPGSEWNSHMGRRQSDPMESWNSNNTSFGGRSAGPWGGDGVIFGDPDQDSDLAALPSTSFGNEDADMGDDDLIVRKGKHRKSKSYANMSDYERGRRRESGRRSKGDAADANHMFHFSHGQRSDPAGRDSLRQSRGYASGGEAENGTASFRRDSRQTSTLPNRSFHHSQPASSGSGAGPFDPDEQIPLDREPHASHSPVRDSMGPEDEELFAGLSLALYSFEPENSNELRLVEGQEIMVSYRHGQGWLVASDPRSGEQGLVPEAYVRLIADMPNYDPETGEFVDVDGDEEGEEEGNHVDESEPSHDRVGSVEVQEDRSDGVPIMKEDDEQRDRRVQAVQQNQRQTEE